MEVIIAGVNKTEDGYSPEVISASYARTSRQEKSIPEIREEAKLDLKKARDSNSNIIFGVGHSSIAEHAVFNIDIIDVSRYLVEFIESHRLVSYTEKSQRYVLFNGDYVIPKELSDDEKIEYTQLIEEQNKFYHELYPILLEYFKNKNEEKYNKDPKTVEGWAKEDARYIISLATKTQLGMTISARNLELMIRRLRAADFSEAHELADKLYNEAHYIAPSLFPYTNPTPLEIKNIKRQNIPLSEKELNLFINGGNSVYLEYPIIDDHDDILCCYLNSPFFLDSPKNIIKESLREMKVHDSAPREFEMIDFTFSLLISASCYAQLKRHRMMTIITKPYNTKNVVIPESVKETNMSSKFMEIVNKSNEFFKKTNCYYVLTNSHTRLVYIKLNLREMYHFCRMRQDLHAQWEIRNTANEMNKLATDVCPNGMMLCCGKHQFDEVYKKIFNE